MPHEKRRNFPRRQRAMWRYHTIYMNIPNHIHHISNQCRHKQTCQEVQSRFSRRVVKTKCRHGAHCQHETSRTRPRRLYRAPNGRYPSGVGGRQAENVRQVIPLLKKVFCKQLHCCGRCMESKRFFVVAVFKVNRDGVVKAYTLPGTNFFVIDELIMTIFLVLMTLFCGAVISL